MTILYWGIEYIACFIEVFALFCFGDIFVPTKINNKTKRITMALIALFIIMLNNIKLISIFSTAIIVLVCWLTLYIFRKEKGLLLLFVVIFYMAIIMSIDFVFYSILHLSTGINFYDFSNNFTLYRVGLLLGSKTFLIVLCLFMLKISKNNTIEGKMPSIIMAISSLIMTFLSTIMYFMQIKQGEQAPQMFILVFFVIMLVMIITIYYSLVFIVKREKIKQDYLLIKQKNILLQRSLTEQEETLNLWRKSLHDYKHKLLAFQSLIISEKYNELRADIEEELNLFKDKAFYLHSGNDTVDIVLNSKMYYAQSQGITFTVNTKITEKTEITDTNLAVILGNLIDNAIEAVIHEENKNIHIQISQIKEMLVIKIINSFSGDKLTFESSKEDTMFHGIGLKSVKHIVDKYNGSFSIELKDKCVIALVTI